MSDNPKSFIEHLIDLRSVIVRSVFAVIISMITCCVFVDNIIEFLLSPIKTVLQSKNIDFNVIYTSVSEPLTTDLRVCFYTSLVFVFPFILYEIWKFVKVALTDKEKLVIKKILITSNILFFLGVIFAFFVVIPNILNFLIDGKGFLKFLPKLSENVSFMMILLLSFGISFQIPVVMIGLDKLHIISIKVQRRIWREFVASIVVISAIITPPDALSMIFLAVPLIALYFLSILFCEIF